MKASAAVLCVLMLAYAALAASAEQREPWIEPHDPIAAANDSDRYAWRLFVALNWPADPASGAPDSSRTLGADSPVVWQTWQNAKAIFLPDGRDPGPWSGGRNADVIHAAERFDGLPLKPDIPTRHIVDGVMTPLTDPIAAASHLNERRVNRVSFTYIRDQQLYNLDGQLKHYRDREPIVFPTGARQVKAQWRPIDASQKSRYFSIEITLADGSRRLYGLTALHLVTKDLPAWFWATFEHVDNASRPGAASWHVDFENPPGDGAGHSGFGPIPQDLGLQGTVWENYRLGGTMTSYLDSQGRPAVLGNSQLESGVQPDTVSCITCHARASIRIQNGDWSRLPIFDEGDSQPALPGGSRTAPRKGFVGTPRPEWFETSAGDDPASAPYLQTDFVWTLGDARLSTVKAPGENSKAKGVMP